MNATSHPPCPEVTALDVDVRDSASLLRAVAARVAAHAGVTADAVYRALQRRELAASTALGHGVAVPHARIVALPRPTTLFLRTKTPIAFRAPDREPVRLFYAILVPADGDPESHLALLARVVEAFRDPVVRERLTAAADERAVHDALAAVLPA